MGTAEGDSLTELRLPRLVGARETVRELVAEAQVPGRIDGDFVVYGDDLATGSGSAADELVKQALEVRGARRLVVVSAPKRFEERLTAAAADRHVTERLVFQHAAGIGSGL
jgi:hypothetical protein